MKNTKIIKIMKANQKLTSTRMVDEVVQCHQQRQVEGTIITMTKRTEEAAPFHPQLQREGTIIDLIKIQRKHPEEVDHVNEKGTQGNLLQIQKLIRLTTENIIIILAADVHHQIQVEGEVEQRKNLVKSRVKAVNMIHMTGNFHRTTRRNIRKSIKEANIIAKDHKIIFYFNNFEFFLNKFISPLRCWGKQLK